VNTRPLLSRTGAAALAWLVGAIRTAVAALVVLLTGAKTVAKVPSTGGRRGVDVNRHGHAGRLGAVTRTGRATRTDRTETRAADHSVTVIATRDGRPMAVAVAFPLIGKATAPTPAHRTAATVPGPGTRCGQLLGAVHDARLGPPARAPAEPPP
jgi:hypothetical protein